MDNWLPVALGRDIPAGATRSVLLDGAERVLWRGADGAIHLWEDRCPHRGMRLSFGFVRGNSLNCLYHGWEYGSGAQCLRIPAHPDLTVPPTIRAKAFPVAEAGGLVWTRPDHDDTAALPSVPPGLAPLASLAVDASVDAVLAAAGATPDSPLFPLLGPEAALLLGWHPVDSTRTMLHALLQHGEPAAGLRLLRTLRATAEQEIAA